MILRANLIGRRSELVVDKYIHDFSVFRLAVSGMMGRLIGGLVLCQPHRDPSCAGAMRHGSDVARVLGHTQQQRLPMRILCASVARMVSLIDSIN
jgi:hypothetical protein